LRKLADERNVADDDLLGGVVAGFSHQNRGGRVEEWWGLGRLALEIRRDAGEGLEELPFAGGVRALGKQRRTCAISSLQEMSGGGGLSDSGRRQGVWAAVVSTARPAW
jgi:hypothetical protein